MVPKFKIQHLKFKIALSLYLDPLVHSCAYE